MTGTVFFIPHPTLYIFMKGDTRWKLIAGIGLVTPSLAMRTNPFDESVSAVVKA